MRSLFIAIFALLTLLPGLQMLTHAIPVVPIDENRARAPFPTRANFAEYTASLEKWFNDSYGLRDLLIRAKTQLDYSVFHTSDRIHIGARGWLYYRSVIDQQEPVVEALADRDLNAAIDTFARLRDWLGARGIRLAVQTNQMKDRFYPDFLPAEAAFARTRHRFDDFRARLAALPGITHLDTTPLLLALRQQRQVFHKTDFHWNDPAAFEAARQLVDTLAGQQGLAVPFWKPRLRIVERRISGGEAMFMPLFRPPMETALFVEPDWDDSRLIHDYNLAPFEWRKTARDPHPPLLAPTVIFGDSFADGMVRSGLASHFDRISYARVSGAALPDVLRALPQDTRIVVVEFIEVSLPSWVAMKLPD